MSNPSILPSIWAADVTYTISDTGFAAIDVHISDIDEEASQILLTIPAGSEVAVLRNPADWSGTGTAILSAGAWISPVALGDWQVSVMPGVLVTDQATVNVTSNTSNAGGLLRILITNLGGQAVSIEPGGGTLSIDRVLAEPTIINVQVSSGLPVREKDAVTLSASTSTTVVENGAPITPLPALPSLLSAWSEAPDNTLALSDFSNMGTTASFTAPAVYDNSNLDFTITAALDLNNNATLDPGDPQTSAPLQVTIQVIRYGMALVLDRSGSMGSSLDSGLSKWEIAVQAAHAWTDLFRAFRPGDEHMAGVVTFEHDDCSWSLTADDEVTFRDPANGNAIGPAELAQLHNFGDVNAWNLGTVQSCTPIGDALIHAWQGIGNALVADDAGAVILITDGYENSGRVTIAAEAGPAETTFNTERAKPALAVPNDLIGNRLYALAIGSSVDEDRINDLALGYYQQITNKLAEIKPALAAMLGDVLDAQEMTPEPPLASDPESPANALYYRQSSGEQLLAFLITWNSITDNLRVGWRDQGSSASFTIVNPDDAAFALTRRGAHGLLRVDLNTLFSGASPALEWRLQHLDNSDTPVPLPVEDALVMVDLFTKVEVGFDKRQYFIGDEIKLTCAIRNGGRLVKEAYVGVDCARPGEGLGTFLTNHASRYSAPKRPPHSHTPDPNQGKGLMFKTLLASLEMNALPIITPPQFELFDDGNHDDGLAGDGNFANVYADTEKEGTYTFRFRITGTLSDGSKFSRIFTRSTWVGVRPDPVLLQPVWRELHGTADGRIVSLVTFQPKTTKNEFLGPFRTAVINVTAHDGELDGPIIDNIDGSYSQRIIHNNNVDPIVEIDIYGEPMKPTGPGIENNGMGTNDCCKLWRSAIRCTLTRVWKHLFGN